MPACQVCVYVYFGKKQHSTWLHLGGEVGKPNYLCLCSTHHNIGVCAAWSCRVDLDAIVIEKKVYVCASEC